MTRSNELELKVGIFVAVGLALIMFTILLLGGGNSFFQSGVTFFAKFHQTEGLVEGATVKIGGVRVGQVTNISLVEETGDVSVEMAVMPKFKKYIKSDSTVGIQTQGVLGDRYLVVSTGSPGTALATPNSELKIETPKELKDYLSSADHVLDSLKSSLSSVDAILKNFNKDNRSDLFFKNLTNITTSANESSKQIKESVTHLDSIMAKVDRGDGTLGALINDPSLYDDLKALLGGANRNKVLKYFIKKSVESSRDVAEKKEHLN